MRHLLTNRVVPDVKNRTCLAQICQEIHGSLSINKQTEPNYLLIYIFENKTNNFEYFECHFKYH